MSNIIQLQPSSKPEPEPRKPMHVQMDEFTLQVICDWRGGRAAQALAWTRADRETLFGTKDADPDIDRLGMELVEKMEPHLANAKPYSVRVARELLDCCMDMLLAQEKDPESFHARGPIFSILKSVHKALEEMDGDTRLALFCSSMRECDELTKKREADQSPGAQS